MTIANVRLEQHDDTPVAFLNGDVDAANAFRVGEELIAAVTNRAQPGAVINGWTVVVTQTQFGLASVDGHAYT